MRKVALALLLFYFLGFVSSLGGTLGREGLSVGVVVTLGREVVPQQRNVTRLVRGWLVGGRYAGEHEGWNSLDDGEEWWMAGLAELKLERSSAECGVPKELAPLSYHIVTLTCDCTEYLLECNIQKKELGNSETDNRERCDTTHVDITFSCPYYSSPNLASDDCHVFPNSTPQQLNIPSPPTVHSLLHLPVGMRAPAFCATH